MKAVLVETIGSFTIKEMDIPRPGEEEVLLHVTVTGLCRTDLKLIRVGHRDLILPRIPGEEVVGRVYELGKNVKGYSINQRVYVYPGTSCGNCAPSRAGAGNLCHQMNIMGFHRHGGFAEYVLAPAKSLIALPDAIADEEAVFAEPLSCCLNALEQAKLKEQEAIGIWGAGPAGTLIARASAALKATPFIIEPDASRRSLLSGYPAPPEMKFDVCIVAVGSRDAYSQALSCLNPRGRLVVFSGLPQDGAGVMVNFNQLHYHEQSISGAYGCAFRHGELALEYIGSGQIKVRDLISHRLPLEELDHALDLVEKRSCMKIHLYP